jgi:hypothetical protein
MTLYSRTRTHSMASEKREHAPFRLRGPNNGGIWVWRWLVGRRESHPTVPPEASGTATGTLNGEKCPQAGPR